MYSIVPHQFHSKFSKFVVILKFAQMTDFSVNSDTILDLINFCRKKTFGKCTVAELLKKFEVALTFANLQK